MPVPQSVVEAGQREAFVAWLNESFQRSGLSKLALARSMDHDTTQQVNKFLRGEILPMPATLKQLCSEMNAPWPVGFVLAGYYGEILHVLSDLARLAKLWRTEDRTYPEDDPEFRSLGVLKIGNQPVSDALATDRRMSDRYHVGCYCDVPHEVEVDESIPEEVARIYKEEAANPKPRCFVVPKPLAIAILTAAAGFPRRGDVWKDNASVFAAHLLEKAAPLIDHAITHRPRRSALPPTLHKCMGILKDNRLSFGIRRVIAAEFMVEWADSLCGHYTYYARLAAFWEWGEVGSTVSTVSPYVTMPQRKIAQLPAIEELIPLELTK